MKKICKIGLVGLLGLVGLAGGLQAQATLSADTIVLGDQTTLTIPRTDTCPSTEQLSQNGIVALQQEFDSIHNTLRTTLTSFEPGVHYIMLSPDDSLPLTVLDVDVDTTTAEIRDIAAIEEVPYTFWEIFRWVLLGLGIMALAFAAWWIYTHRRKIQEIVGLAEPVDTRTPEERALDKLESLRKKQLWQSGRAKEYHTELTDSVRLFIEEAVGIHATEMTSEECVNALARHGVSTGATALLRDVFATADLVKFAKNEPLPYEHQQAHNNAVEFIKETWKCVYVPPSNGEEGNDTKEEEVKNV